MKRYKNYLFDFDGTIVDSMSTFGSVMIRILVENNIKFEKEVINNITPLGYVGVAKYFIENFGFNMAEDELLSMMRQYIYNEYENNIQAKNNAISTLKNLKDAGANLNILTASPHLVVDVCLKRLNIYDLFTNIWSSDDFNLIKNNPDIYISACKKLNCNPKDVLFVDDNYIANMTAKNAGMSVCGIYDKSSDQYVDDIKRVADYYIYDFSELL